LATPTFVLITISKITDAEVFKGAMHAMAADTSIADRVAMDTDKPVYWEGTVPEHVVVIQFDNPDQAQGWKNSDAFKNFDTELRRSSESRMQGSAGIAHRSRPRRWKSSEALGTSLRGSRPLPLSAAYMIWPR
jgi:uncharacterized protein (DUF1330 family)